MLCMSVCVSVSGEIQDPGLGVWQSTVQVHSMDEAWMEMDTAYKGIAID